jgi:hypothetical protein
MHYYSVYYETSPHLFPAELAKKLGIINTDIKMLFFYSHENEQNEISIRPALELYLSKDKDKYDNLVIKEITEISEEQYLDEISIEE